MGRKRRRIHAWGAWIRLIIGNIKKTVLVPKAQRKQ
jgi:hypothetical protein